jgi:hypothetical protein
MTRANPVDAETLRTMTQDAKEEAKKWQKQQAKEREKRLKEEQQRAEREEEERFDKACSDAVESVKNAAKSGQSNCPIVEIECYLLEPRDAPRPEYKEKAKIVKMLPLQYKRLVQFLETECKLTVSFEYLSVIHASEEYNPYGGTWDYYQGKPERFQMIAAWD